MTREPSKPPVWSKPPPPRPPPTPFSGESPDDYKRRLEAVARAVAPPPKYQHPHPALPYSFHMLGPDDPQQDIVAAINRLIEDREKFWLAIKQLRQSTERLRVDNKRLDVIADAVDAIGIAKSEEQQIAELSAEILALKKERDAFKANADLYWSILVKHGLGGQYKITL